MRLAFSAPVSILFHHLPTENLHDAKFALAGEVRRGQGTLFQSRG